MDDVPAHASRILGDRIVGIRTRASLSASALAECADLDLSHLQRIEKGTGNPTLFTLLQLAEALEVDVEELVTGIRAADLPERHRPYRHSDRERYRRRPRDRA
ncbi:helix-turn-helix domain-containing protein [Microbacterium gilvum]|uniref:HTH cro/C1-type domain-containing protein n=1 Tax=Microbacterium gilvum TaxID=1336204 RepID=A0ABP9AIP7_9MICO